MEAGRGEAQHAQGDGEWESFLGVGNGGQDGALGVAIGHPQRVEAEAGEADEQEGQADDGKEKPDPALEGEDLGLEFLLVEGEDLGGDDGTRAATEPTCGGGTRDTEVTEQHGVTFFADEVAKSVVIRMATGGGWHASRLIGPGSWGKSAEGQFLQQFRGGCSCAAENPECSGAQLPSR